MRRYLWGGLGLGVSFSLACSLSLNAATPTPAPDATLLRSDKPRLIAQEDPAAITALTAGQRAFAFDLYGILRAQDGNLIYSPYSIAGAFALAQAGARGDTAAEIASVFHFPDESLLHPTFSALDQSLSKPAPTPEPDPSGTPQPDHSFQLRIANAAWGQRDYHFEASYLDLLAEQYGAGLHVVDFADPTTAADEINRWVAEQTADRITDLVPPSQLNPDTRLALTNAVYFKAGWADEFVALPDPMPFTPTEGATIDAPAITTHGFFAYTEVDGVQIVAVPYAGGRISFVALMPAVGEFDAFEDRLTQAWFDTALATLAGTDVIFTMPKLDYESRFGLAPALESLGVLSAFSSGAADFSGIDGTRDLFISAVIHQANITLDETGTEAAAATALIMEAGAAPPITQPLTLTLDHPYLYLIRDDATGAPLFVGRVLDPTK